VSRLPSPRRSGPSSRPPPLPRRHRLVRPSMRPPILPTSSAGCRPDRFPSEPRVHGGASPLPICAQTEPPTHPSRPQPTGRSIGRRPLSSVGGRLASGRAPRCGRRFLRWARLGLEPRPASSLHAGLTAQTPSGPHTLSTTRSAAAPKPPLFSCSDSRRLGGFLPLALIVQAAARRVPLY